LSVLQENLIGDFYFKSRRFLFTSMWYAEVAAIAEWTNQTGGSPCQLMADCVGGPWHANLLPVALAAERKTVILTDSHEFATARLA
jgi:hypothetical protein